MTAALNPNRKRRKLQLLLVSIPRCMLESQDHFPLGPPSSHAGDRKHRNTKLSTTHGWWPPTVFRSKLSNPSIGSRLGKTDAPLLARSTDHPLLVVDLVESWQWSTVRSRWPLLNRRHIQPWTSRAAN